MQFSLQEANPETSGYTLVHNICKLIMHFPLNVRDMKQRTADTRLSQKKANISLCQNKVPPTNTLLTKQPLQVISPLQQYSSPLKGIEESLA
jgi:hypothetical protein